jgi:hypothetical protein
MAGAEPEQSRRDLVGMLIAFCLNYGLSWQWYGFFARGNVALLCLALCGLAYQ